VLYYTAIIIGMIVLLYLMANTFWDIRQSIKKIYNPQIPLIKMSLWGFLFGILIEWRALKTIIQGNIKINWLLFPAILLSIVCFIPSLYWSMWFGNGAPFYIQMFSIAETQMLLTVFSGILLVRSFTN
jgi:hypothetical protein